jgi:hypothetical protein
MPEYGSRSLDRLAVISLGTRMVLLQRLSASSAIDAIGQKYLSSESLPYVNRVADGLRASSRADDADALTLQDLVRRAGVVETPWPWTPDGLAAAVAAARERSLHAPKLALDAGELLVNLGHARLVFALLPRTPAYAVGWPGRRASYADIDRPRDLSEITIRIEELERTLWAAATGPLRTDPMIRRAYAFFETGALLATEGIGAFDL